MQVQLLPKERKEVLRKTTLQILLGFQAHLFLNGKQDKAIPIYCICLNLHRTSTSVYDVLKKEDY